ncbi:phosphatase PAP2 family protein [Cryobacterium melibiosiphilum]|uniref:Phosphatase PAP2 family protein n=1 Tax=Cryobacterium melibiosiphilum TaxID=995039 RepID=A0A3A5MP02_9MICO|nr:phosphatase PAP2 family protein [Cryobacterium melibiosiphilum]RJT88878.1 phosphatase PAP2 family protein [Cryobacterium melibiosiphilum]
MNAPRDPAVTTPPRARWLTRHWLPVTGLGAVALAVVLGALIAARTDGPLAVDTAWLGLLNQNRSVAGDVVADTLAVLGGGIVASLLIPGAIIVALLLVRRRWGAAYVLIATVLAGASVQILKQLLGRDRPMNVLTTLDYGSFPSGHVANAAVVATVLALLVPRVWVWVVGGVYTILMMLSRTYLGAHWLSDAVGAVLLAVGVALLVWTPLAARIEGERALSAGQPAVWHTFWARHAGLVVHHDHDADARRRLVRTAVTVASLGATVCVALLVSVLGSTGLTIMDVPAQNLVLSWRSAELTGIMIALAIVFGPVVLPIIVLVVAVGWGITSRHAWRPALLVAGMAFGVVLGQVVGRAVDRQRPPVDLMLFGADASFSFPSGHVLGAADFALITTYLVLSRRPSRRGTVIGSAVAALGIVLAALSRVYLGYHWVTDVLTSVALALIVLGCVIIVDVWWGARSEPGAPGASEAIPAVGHEPDADRA